MPRKNKKQRLFSNERLEKKQTIYLWNYHALCDSVLIYERNR